MQQRSDSTESQTDRLLRQDAYEAQVQEVQTTQKPYEQLPSHIRIAATTAAIMAVLLPKLHEHFLSSSGGGPAA